MAQGGPASVPTLREAGLVMPWHAQPQQNDNSLPYCAFLSTVLTDDAELEVGS